MQVVKRNGKRESISFDKVLERIRRLCNEGKPLVGADPILVAQKTIEGIYDGVRTTELDNLAAETAAYLSTTHPDFGKLAARIAISNLQKETPSTFYEAMRLEYKCVCERTKEHAPLIAGDVWKIIRDNKEQIEAEIVHYRDYKYDYFGFRTLEKSYLARVNKRIVERPQYLLMRVAIGIHKADLENAFKTYHLMSTQRFTHATPTLFQAGTCMPQMSSCFLVTMKDDSVDGIYSTLRDAALISKGAGGLGISIHNIRASHSYIKGSAGESSGIVPLLRVANETARYINQGGKRKGSFAIYLEPWHADIFDFLELKKPHGKEEIRSRDLFYALWIPDLFMKRVETNGEWSLFCPNEAKGLFDKWGAEFEELYNQYEQAGLARRTIKAQTLWFAILESQIETGTPYMMYKDACNRKSNQQNLGTIRSSNLCCEIVEYTAPDEVAVCNLASIALPKFFDKKTRTFNHQKLFEVTQQIAFNLNRVIDENYYPIPEARNSNMRHRPIGIGVQGLADVFMKLRYPFTSPEAKQLNSEIFETIYFAALTCSNMLAKDHSPYSSFPGSPASRGILQYQMWGVEPSKRWDWATLIDNIKKYGLRNSLLVAPMPTASTAHILGNNEGCEPYTTNLYSRRVLAGEFTVLNKHLHRDLEALGLWSNDLKQEIIAHKGSIQNIPNIPQELKDLYKIVWEISQKDLIDMAADRGAFIDQSQSFNCFVARPTSSNLTTMHFYGWKKGLKTGMYYLRTLPAAEAIQFTLDVKPKAAAVGTTTAATTKRPPPAAPRQKEQTRANNDKKPPTMSVVDSINAKLKNYKVEPHVYFKIPTIPIREGMSLPRHLLAPWESAPGINVELDPSQVEDMANTPLLKSMPKDLLMFMIKRIEEQEAAEEVAFFPVTKNTESPKSVWQEVNELPPSPLTPSTFDKAVDALLALPGNKTLSAKLQNLITHPIDQAAAAPGESAAGININHPNVQAAAVVAITTAATAVNHPPPPPSPHENTEPEGEICRMEEGCIVCGS